MGDLRAITVRQPWARCIAGGVKLVENRTRPTKYRGMLAIHAAKRHSPEGDRDPRVLRHCGKDPRIGAPVGAIIAIANLVDCHQASDRCCGEWGDSDCWHLRLGGIRPLVSPVYTPGSLAMPWRVPDGPARLVMAQLDDPAVAAASEWVPVESAVLFVEVLRFVAGKDGGKSLRQYHVARSRFPLADLADRAERLGREDDVQRAFDACDHKSGNAELAIGAAGEVIAAEDGA